MKVAIVQDWMVGGGAERVTEELHKLYPDAPIYTSYATDEWRKRLDGKIVTGWLQGLGKIRKFIPFLRIWWFTHLDLSAYDLVISNSGNGEALGVKKRKDAVHINYCNAPTHFYWRFYNEYLKNPGFGIFNPLARVGLWMLVKPLRAWDYKAAQRADYFVANSTHIQSEVKEFYKRDSELIFPPVNVERFSAATAADRRGFVIAGRQVPAKKIDVAIKACNELKLPLIVIGRGPEHENLKKIAGDTVVFRDNVSDEEMPKLFASAKGFIFPSYEDFGVTPVEALAAGTPVIAYRNGGALDFVREGVNGMFFDVQTVPALCAALQKFSAQHYSESAVRKSAQTFSSERFRREFKAFIGKATEGKA